jgi:hypothetical protein
VIYVFEDNDNFIEVRVNFICSTKASSNPTDQEEQIGSATTSIASGSDQLQRKRGSMQKKENRNSWCHFHLQQ